uniref:Uncharacterized protein n=1 Tax=Fagus sylvatica TaxID=28930 RepID=A0A2N9GYR3_FAGSY
MVAIKQQGFASIWKELVPPQLPLDVFYGLLWLATWWSNFMLGGCLGMLLAKTTVFISPNATAMPWVAKAMLWPCQGNIMDCQGMPRPCHGLGRNLPPDWGCIPKQPDSPTAPRGATGSGHNGALTLSGAPFQGTWARSAAERTLLQTTIRTPRDVRFSSWALPGSLAVTKGILLRRRLKPSSPFKALVLD